MNIYEYISKRFCEKFIYKNLLYKLKCVTSTVVMNCHLFLSLFIVIIMTIKIICCTASFSSFHFIPSPFKNIVSQNIIFFNYSRIYRNFFSYSFFFFLSKLKTNLIREIYFICCLKMQYKHIYIQYIYILLSYLCKLHDFS